MYRILFLSILLFSPTVLGDRTVAERLAVENFPYPAKLRLYTNEGKTWLSCSDQYLDTASLRVSNAELILHLKKIIAWVDLNQSVKVKSLRILSEYLRFIGMENGDGLAMFSIEGTYCSLRGKDIPYFLSKIESNS